MNFKMFPPRHRSRLNDRHHADDQREEYRDITLHVINFIDDTIGSYADAPSYQPSRVVLPLEHPMFSGG